MENVSAWVALGGGLLSLLSPCILPLIPVYLAVLAGPAAAGEGPGRRRLLVFRHSLLFLAGFTLVFVALGGRGRLGGSPVRRGFQAGPAYRRKPDDTIRTLYADGHPLELAEL